MRKQFFTLGLALVSAISWAEPKVSYVTSVGSADCRMYYVVIMEDNGTAGNTQDDYLIASGWITDCDPHSDGIEQPLAPTDPQLSPKLDAELTNTQQVSVHDENGEHIRSCFQYTVRVSDPQSGVVLATGVLFDEGCLDGE